MSVGNLSISIRAEHHVSGRHLHKPVESGYFPRTLELIDLQILKSSLPGKGPHVLGRCVGAPVTANQHIELCVRQFRRVKV